MMRSRPALLADPMMGVLIAATALALVLPAAGPAREVAQDIASAAIFLLFLVNGMRVARGEILRGVADWRFFGALALFVFGIMAIAGWAVSLLAAVWLPPLVALGFLYLGVLPSTVQSATSYATLAGGNVALSVVAAAVINIMGVFLAAPLFAVLAGSEAVAVGTDALVRIVLILVLPFLIGQALQGWTRDWVVARKARIVWLDRVVIGIAVYVAFSGAVEQGLMRQFGGADWLALIALTLAMMTLAHFAAWIAGGLVARARADRIAFLFAGAQKSVAIGAPLAAILFVPDQAGFVIAPLLLYHLFQLIAAAPLAAHLRRSGD